MKTRRQFRDLLAKVIVVLAIGTLMPQALPELMVYFSQELAPESIK